MKKQTVKLTNNELVNCVNALNQLFGIMVEPGSGINPKLTLGIMQGFPFTENLRTMQPEADVVWQTRNKIIQKYTKKNEDGSVATIKEIKQDKNGKPIKGKDGKEIVLSEDYAFETPEDKATAVQEMIALNAIEAEVKLYKLPLEAFEVFGDQPLWAETALKPMMDLEE